MLTVSGLNQYYGGSHTLRDIAFEVPSGAVTAVLGSATASASRRC